MGFNLYLPFTVLDPYQLSGFCWLIFLDQLQGDPFLVPPPAFFFFFFTLEPPISAMIMESLRFIPPLSEHENALRLSSRLKAASI